MPFRVNSLSLRFCLELIRLRIRVSKHKHLKVMENNNKHVLESCQTIEHSLVQTINLVATHRAKNVTLLFGRCDERLFILDFGPFPSTCLYRVSNSPE
jgi:hypothetical protein